MTALPGWEELPSTEGLAALDRVGEALSSGTPADRVGAKLRKDGVDPDFIAALCREEAEDGGERDLACYLGQH